MLRGVRVCAQGVCSLTHRVVSACCGSERPRFPLTWFWQTCAAALAWLDAAYPGCSIGLYGEPTKAAPLYVDLGFHDVGKTRFWKGSYDADAILRADTASARGAKGKRAVNSRVRAITVGQSTALTVGSVLLPGVLASDERVLGSSRTQALQRCVCVCAFVSVCVISLSLSFAPSLSLALHVCVKCQQKQSK
jgi:hypothetical protein